MRYIIIFTHIHTHCYHPYFIKNVFCFRFQLGYELDDGQLSNLFWRFKAVAEQKKASKNIFQTFNPIHIVSPDCLCSLVIQRVTDADLIALVSDEVFQPEAVWTLLDMQVKVGAGICFLSFRIPSSSSVNSYFDYGSWECR